MAVIGDQFVAGQAPPGEGASARAGLVAQGVVECDLGDRAAGTNSAPVQT
jgi:hypothetical protein